MENIMGKRVMKILAGMMLAFVLVASGFYTAEEYLMVRRSVYTDKNQETILYNPLIGYAPSADYHDAVGSNTLVYIDTLWSEIEPQQGVYDFESLYEDNHIYEYKAAGKKAVFRLVCDVPGSEEHMDIPQWLYDMTGDGSFYDTDYGKGYSPNYANETLIQAHERLLHVIAEEFSKDNFIAYVELGSLGHWGEWHVKTGEGIVPIPTEEICMRYVAQYVECFPDTCLLMRRPFLGVREYGLGVYNDMTGEPESTKEWMDWLGSGGEYTEPADVHTLYAMPDFYKNAPAGGEFTSRFTWQELLVENYDRTREMIEASHMSFIGPKCPHPFSAEAFQQEADALRECLGYKLGIGSAEICYHKISKKWDIVIQLNNKGTAPIYYDWDCCMYVYNASGERMYRIKLPVSLSEIMPGDTCSVHVKQWFEGMEVSKITVAVEDPMTGMPAVRLNNAAGSGDDPCEVTIFSENTF